MPEMTRRLKILLRPEHQVYLLIHILLFVGGLFVALLGGPLWIAIGTSISATGVCGWAIFFWIRLNETTQGELTRIRQVGITDAFPARSVPIRPEYERRFNSARRHIDFLGFGLRALREDFGDDFSAWLQRVHIRILLVDPDAPASTWKYTSQRDHEENNSPGSIHNDVCQFLNFLTPVKTAFPSRLQVRLYTCLPALNICRIDEELFWGPYVLGRQSRNTPTFLTTRPGLLFGVLSDHYEAVFSDRFSRDAYTNDEGVYKPAINTFTLTPGKVYTNDDINRS